MKTNGTAPISIVRNCFITCIIPGQVRNCFSEKHNKTFAIFIEIFIIVFTCSSVRILRYLLCNDVTQNNVMLKASKQLK